MWLSRRIMSLLLGTQIKDFRFMWEDKEAAEEYIGGRWSFQWIYVADTGTPMPRTQCFRLMEMAKTSLCGSDLELAKPPTSPRVNADSVWNIWVFLYNWLVCVKTSNSNFFLMDVPSPYLLAFRDLLPRLSASVLCIVSVLRFPVIVWLALCHQHAQTSDPAFLGICAFFIPSLYILCLSLELLKDMAEKKICLSWVRIIEFLNSLERICWMHSLKWNS